MARVGLSSYTCGAKTGYRCPKSSIYRHFVRKDQKWVTFTPLICFACLFLRKILFLTEWTKYCTVIPWTLTWTWHSVEIALFKRAFVLLPYENPLIHPHLRTFGSFCNRLVLCDYSAVFGAPQHNSECNKPWKRVSELTFSSGVT